MKYVSEKLNNLLLSGRMFWMTELYTFNIPGIEIPIRLTALDIDLVVGGISYKSAPISRSSITETTGTSVDDLTVTWNLKQTDFIPGSTTPILHQLRYGLFDAAGLVIDRLFSPEPWYINMPSIDPDYVLANRFSGLVNVDKLGIISTDIKVSSPSKLLDVNMPKILYEPQCTREFGAPDCSISKQLYTRSGKVLSGDINSIASNLYMSDGYFNLGVLTFTSGVNLGIRRGVRYSTLDGTIQFTNPLPKLSNANDSFEVYPGCNKTRDKCSFYNNSDNFRGFPFIPVPETSL